MPSERAASATICNFFAVFIGGNFLFSGCCFAGLPQPPWRNGMDNPSPVFHGS
jgi:hypothetical protein